MILADGASLDEVLIAVGDVPDWVPTGPTMIERLARQMHGGDLIWTRDRSGAYWL